MDSTRRAARRAGLLYLLLAATAPIGLMYVPGQLIVAGDAAATADKIRASEWLLRLGIGSELFHQAVVIFLVLALYRVFKGVNDKSQLDGLAYLFLRLHGQGLVVASIFWGLWLLPFGTLVIRCGFMPRILGYMLFLAGGGYLAAAFAALITPRYAPVVGQVTGVLMFFELPIVFYLVIWGARKGPAGAAPPAEAR